jgi:hypothetical protein
MTDRQINIAIARACGWKSFEETDGDPWLWARTTADGRIESTMEVLPYCTDLNVMHIAEKHLFEARKDNTYGYQLATSECQTMWHVTARQRAEAFLRTLGKWEEGE